MLRPCSCTAAAGWLPLWLASNAFSTCVWCAWCSDEVKERFANLKKRVADVGKHRVVDHFRAMERNPRRQEQRQWVMDNLEGVDVYFDGVPLDGHLDSKTKFCKMCTCLGWGAARADSIDMVALVSCAADINPFPFEVVLAYDDSDDVNFLFEGDFDKFVAQNTSPGIVERRNNRRVCRGLQVTGAYVSNPFTRMESHTVEDGQEHYTDSEGRSHTRTRYTSVQVLMSYTQGKMNVKTTGGSAYARGFKASLHYTDGSGTAIAPHTGQAHHITNSCVPFGHRCQHAREWDLRCRPPCQSHTCACSTSLPRSHTRYTMPAHEFGLDDTFRTSPKWRSIMDRNFPQVQQALTTLAAQDANYRKVQCLVG